MTSEASLNRPGVLRRLGAAGPVAIALSFAPPLGGFVLLATLTTLGPWLRDHQQMGWLIYLLIATSLIGISFVPTYSCAILAGWAFGFSVGWPLAIVATTIASVIAYAIGRGIARDRVLDVVHERPRWNAIYRELLSPQSGRPMLVTTLLRIPPASPFALANFVLAAARVPLFDYVIGTLVGIIPRTALTTFAGAGLERLRFDNVLDRWMVIAGFGATLIVCIALGMLANRALRTITRVDP